MKARLVKHFKLGNSIFETYTYMGYTIKYTSFIGWLVYDNKDCVAMVDDLSSAENFVDQKLGFTI